MLAAEREDDALLGRRRLQLEVESLAELLAQGEAPGAVDAAAERRVQHQLHAARLVEEALEREHLARGHHAEAALALGEVLRDLLGGLSLQEVIPLQKRNGGLQLSLLSRCVGPRQLEV